MQSGLGAVALAVFPVALGAFLRVDSSGGP